MLDTQLGATTQFGPHSVHVQPLGCTRLCSGSGKRHLGCRATHAFVEERVARQGRCEGLEQGHRPGVLPFSLTGDLIIPRHLK